MAMPKSTIAARPIVAGKDVWAFSIAATWVAMTIPVRIRMCLVKGSRKTTVVAAVVMIKYADRSTMVGIGRKTERSLSKPKSGIKNTEPRYRIAVKNPEIVRYISTRYAWFLTRKREQLEMAITHAPVIPMTLIIQVPLFPKILAIGWIEKIALIM